MVGIFTNPARDIDLEYTRQIAGWLLQRGMPSAVYDESVPDALAALHRAAFWIVLGGDGTMLHAAREAAVRDIPLFGINLGYVGYLTDVDRIDGFDALQKVLDGDYYREKRMMLAVGPQNELVLNEVVLGRDGPAKLMTFQVKANGVLVDTLRADGLIVATPTGSTAYNLSAGGPVLQPQSEMLILTPICPQNLYARPCVLSADNEITITLTDDKRAVCALDAREPSFYLEQGDALTVRRAPCCTTVIKTNEATFFEVLRKKARQW